MPSSSGANVTEALKPLDAATLAERAGWRGWIAWIGLAVMSLIALALGVAYFNRSAIEPRGARLSFTPPENLAFDNGIYDYVIVSPDGQKLLFTGRSADGKKQLWVRPLDRVEAQPLPGTDDPQYPFWSPDSRSIGFGSRGKLKRVDLAGGRPQTLCDAVDLRGGTWSRAGVILFLPRAGGSLFQIPQTGGEPQPVTDPASGGEDPRNPRFLPDGRHFLYSVGVGESAQGVFAGSLDSKEVKRLLADGASADYAPPGWLLFERNGALVAQSFDAEHLELKGEAFPLTLSTTMSLAGARFSVSENGVLIWQGDLLRDYRLVWFDREGKQGDAIGAPIKVLTGQSPCLSPDGKRVAIHRIDRQTQNSDIWVIDLQRNLPVRLTSDPDYEALPVWSPDGNRVAFGSAGLHQIVASGAGTEELLLKRGTFPYDWSADGRFIIYAQRVEKTRRDVWAFPITGDRQPYPLLNSEFDEREAQLSPDGRWFAYLSDESGSYEVYVQAFTADGKLGGNKLRISARGGNQPRFRRDGEELFYVAADGQMMSVTVKTSAAAFEPGAPKALFKSRMVREINVAWIDYDVTADGQRFLIGTLVSEGNATPVSVILNWVAEVRR